MLEQANASTTISVFTRHSGGCAKVNDPQWKRCDCRKSIYIREKGRTVYVSAQTRSWDEAERFAQTERDKRDPVKIELQKIAEREEAKRVAELALLTPINEALDQWLAGRKGVAESSLAAYTSTVRKIKKWAGMNKVIYVSDVTPS
jgi:hypothetical protein